MDRTRVCANTQTRAPVQPQILLAVQRKRDGSLEEGQVSTDGALPLSLCLCLSPSLSLPQMDPITPISLSHALKLHNQHECMCTSDLFIVKEKEKTELVSKCAYI